MRVLLALVIAGLTTGATPLPARAQQGVTDAEILLGGSNSFSGPLAFTGEQATRFGVDLYFKAVNDGGGIHGRKVRTVYYDDGYKPQEAVANTRKLLEQDGVFAIIAPQGTPPVVATLEYLEENRVPLLFPFQGSPITRGRKWVFSGMTLYDRQSRMMIDYLVGARKFGKFATLYQDDEYGKSFLTALEKDLGRHGLKLVATESVKRGVTDVSAQMAKLQAARPDVLFLVLTPGRSEERAQPLLPLGLLRGDALHGGRHERGPPPHARGTRRRARGDPWIRERHPAAGHDRPGPRDPAAGVLGARGAGPLQAAHRLAQGRVARGAPRRGPLDQLRRPRRAEWLLPRARRAGDRGPDRPQRGGEVDGLQHRDRPRTPRVRSRHLPRP